MKPVKINKPAIRRLPKVVDTMDAMDKYDPVNETEQFKRELDRIMASTATIMNDPRLDPRDLKLANNYLEWLTGKDFLNFRPYARQIDIGTQLNLDVCWSCSPEYYDGPDINHKWAVADMTSRYVFMKRGVCPRCGATREEGVRRKYIYDKIKHVGVAGQRSSKCLPGSTLISTPSGPIFIKDLFNGKQQAIVRLPTHDVVAHAVVQQSNLTYDISTTEGVNIRTNASHRLLTVESGYVCTKKRDGLRVGMHLEMPALPAIRPERSPKDKAHAHAGEQFYHAVKYGFTEAIESRLWLEPYAFKRAFFLGALSDGLVKCANSFHFVYRDRMLQAVRAWLEATGVPCYYGIFSGRDGFSVNTRKFLREYPEIFQDSPLTYKHYYKLPDADPMILPPACSAHVATTLQTLLNYVARFPWQSNTTAQSNMSDIYASWAYCNQGNSLTRNRLVSIISKLHKWRNLGWTSVERRHYENTIALLRKLLVTRYARVTAIHRHKLETVYDISVPGPEWFVANGYHSHNSTSVGHLIAYTTHRLLLTGDPAAYYGLLPGQTLTCVLTATSIDQAGRNLYTPLRKVFEITPWFKAFTEWTKDRAHVLGVELFRIRDTYTAFRYGALDVRVMSPDTRRIRGNTAYAGATDELGYFDSKENKVRMAGLEAYTAISNACATVNGRAEALREDGENDVIFAVPHAISSPFDESDPVMTLFKTNKTEPRALVYRIPTWRFNPDLSFAACKLIATKPETFMRDFGCVVTGAAGTFLPNISTIYSLCSDVVNAVITKPEIYLQKTTGAKFTIAKLRARWKADDAMACGLALDKGYNDNSYTFCVFHFEEEEAEEAGDGDADETENDENLDDEADVNTGEDGDYDAEDNYDEDDKHENLYDDDDDDDDTMSSVKLVIDALGEVQPGPDRPIHFAQMLSHVIYPLLEDFNVKLVVSDRWETLQMQQDLMEDFEITHIPLRPKKADFIAFRSAIYDQSIILPTSELDPDDIDKLNQPTDFVMAPVAHFIKQCTSVKETPKTVEKGGAFSDDLFRAVLLAHMASEDRMMRDILNTSEQVQEERGPAAILVNKSGSGAASTATTDTHVMLNARSNISQAVSTQGGDTAVSLLHTHK